VKRNIVIIVFLWTCCLVNGQQLQKYIQEAHANNPGVKAYESRYAIAKEKVNEANWVPNTAFDIGYFISEPETRTGAQRARFSARQKLPWFGTISAREKYVNAMAETTHADYLIARRKIELTVAQSYYDLCSLQTILDVLQEHIQVLKTQKVILLNAVEVGKASTVSVLFLQIRQNELNQEREIMQQQIKATNAVFNSLLDRNIDLEIEGLEPLQIPDTDPVIIDSLQINPELLKFDKMYESVVQAEFLNRKENAPRFGLGIDYVPVQERPDLNFDDNGKDIIMPMVSLSVPIFSSRSSSRSKQHELQKQEIELQKQDKTNRLTSRLIEAISQRDQARTTYDTQIKNLTQAKNTADILVKQYETETNNFENILEIQKLQLKFKKNMIVATKEYYIQSAIINYLSQ